MMSKLKTRKGSLGLSLLLVIIFALQSCAPSSYKQPKYIFYFIGDGMGHAQVTAAEAYLSNLENKVGNKQLVMNTFPLLSSISTYSESHFITESSAAATALATGQKTRNSVVSMDSECKHSYSSVAVAAKKHGMKVGILSNVQLNHATPANFYANETTRHKYYEIAMQLPKHDFDFFAGGDLKHPEGKEGGRASVIANAEKAGYTYVRKNADILALKSGDNKIIAVPEECPVGGAMPYCIDKKASDLSLAQLVEKGIEVLDNPDGFFMMCEGGRIDWAGHANDAPALVHEMTDFDDAIAKALEFYKKHPKETLIIVTADHETGGLSLGNAHVGYVPNFKAARQIKSSIEACYSTIKPKLADSKISSKEIQQNIIEIMGFGASELELTEADKKLLTDAIRNKRKRLAALDNYMSQNASNSPVQEAILKITSDKTGFGWTTHDHTGIAVPLKVIGDAKLEFDGYLDNTDVAKKLFTLIGEHR